MNLSPECVLVFVLKHSGCAGRLTSGRVERRGSSGLNVFDYRGNLIDYISGDRTPELVSIWEVRIAVR